MLRFSLMFSLIVFSCLACADVEVFHKDQSCSKDSDCTLVYTQCSGCGCGTPVSVKKQKLYKEKRNEDCADYKGSVCDVWCPESELRCVEGYCEKMLKTR